MMSTRIERFDTVAALNTAAVQRLIRLVNDALNVRPTASVALSGGSSPKAIYTLLGSEEYRNAIDWSRTHLFWGDERCVEPAHADSNYRMARETLLEFISIPESNIHRIQAELRPHEAATHYEQEVARYFNNAIVMPFDVVMLGLGEDGHTASLFPGTPIVEERQHFVSEVYVPRLSTYRVSMTLPLINQAKAVLFVVSGSNKASILRKVLEGEEEIYPAQRVRPAQGTLLWFVDAEAASLLSHSAT